MEIIDISGYIAEEKLAIAKQYLIPQIEELTGLSSDKVSLSEEAINNLNRLGYETLFLGLWLVSWYQTHILIGRNCRLIYPFREVTGMTSRNLAIVWAPNLLRPNNQDCLRDCGLQALVIEAMIVYFEEIFEAETDCVTRRNFTKEVSIDQVWGQIVSY